jgi:hypothetical protein
VEERAAMELQLLSAFSGLDESGLPLSSAALADGYSELKVVLDFLSPRLDYRSEMDAVAAALLPELAIEIEAFYQGNGPSLTELYTEIGIELIDCSLSELIEACQVLGIHTRLAERRRIAVALILSMR